ncbi:hypothetical protein ACWGDT_34500 [Streptomyces avermitilis]
MTRAARVPKTLAVLPALLLLPVLLSACGTEKAGAGAGGADRADMSRAQLDARAAALGVAPELVYVTEAPGFTLAQQSVGVYGGDGFSSVYWSRKTGAQIQLSVDRGTMTAANCPKQPLGDASGERITCARDGDAWYRTAGGRQEYAVPEKGHVVRVSADANAVGRAVLRRAAGAAHRPDDTELAAVLPTPDGTATAPVERGDLPPVGDGAPDNDVGTSG